VERLSAPVSVVIGLKPQAGVGRVIRSEHDLVAVVEGCRHEIAAAMSATGATRLHLFYAGPLAGAAFLGHTLGRAAAEVQVYEDVPSASAGYAPSFLLRA
jgi:hypothetical protein